MTDDDKLTIKYNPDKPGWRDRDPHTRPMFDLPPNLPAGTYLTELHPDGKYRLVEQDLPLLEDLPHSRACGPRKHPHGTECSHNCPSCHGRAPLAGPSGADYSALQTGTARSGRPKKTRAIDKIIVSSKLRFTMLEWKAIEDMLYRAYEDGRAMAGDSDA